MRRFAPAADWTMGSSRASMCVCKGSVLQSLRAGVFVACHYTCVGMSVLTGVPPEAVPRMSSDQWTTTGSLGMAGRLGDPPCGASGARGWAVAAAIVLQLPPSSPLERHCANPEGVISRSFFLAVRPPMPSFPMRGKAGVASIAAAAAADGRLGARTQPP
ncbi:hypothetical protein CC78DRAFT_72005 [Lojkania enalia]|uniref:Uncharacterized protein n=1 Tax=Lojkania enalia TaxID=147567 RepID=A0A9P4MZA5_9PLEO|nr:hypothetical protein CC78DRAFT_72005 [Didymosphaeria enalia]